MIDLLLAELIIIWGLLKPYHSPLLTKISQRHYRLYFIVLFPFSLRKLNKHWGERQEQNNLPGSL